MGVSNVLVMWHTDQWICNVMLCQNNVTQWWPYIHSTINTFTQTPAHIGLDIISNLYEKLCIAVSPSGASKLLLQNRGHWLDWCKAELRPEVWIGGWRGRGLIGTGRRPGSGGTDTWSRAQPAAPPSVEPRPPTPPPPPSFISSHYSVLIILISFMSHVTHLPVASMFCNSRCHSKYVCMHDNVKLWENTMAGRTERVMNVIKMYNVCNKKVFMLDFFVEKRLSMFMYVSWIVQHI